MDPVSHTTTGTSEWLEIQAIGEFRIDVDVPDGLTTSYTLETTNDQAGQAKTVKQPTDATTDWTLTASEALLLNGPVNIRLNVASRSGNSDPIKLMATQVGMGA